MSSNFTTSLLLLVGKYGLQGRPTAKPPQPAQWPAYPAKRGFDEFFGYVRHRNGHQHYPGNSWPLEDSESHQAPQELWHGEQEISAKLDKCFTLDLFTAYAKKWIIDHRKASLPSPKTFGTSSEEPLNSILEPGSRV